MHTMLWKYIRILKDPSNYCLLYRNGIWSWAVVAMPLIPDGFALGSFVNCDNVLHVSSIDRSWKWEVSLWEVSCVLSVLLSLLPSARVSIALPFPKTHVVGSVHNLPDYLIAISLYHWWFSIAFSILIHSSHAQGPSSAFGFIRLCWKTHAPT